MTRATTFIAAVVTSALITGCEPSEQAAKTPEEASRTGTTITVWAHQGQEKENAAMRQIVEAFNKANQGDGLAIDITFFPDRQYADKVSIASASGKLPDMLDIDGPYVGPWAAEGLLQPISDMLDDQLRNDLLPSIIEQGTYKNQLYALGAFDSALVVYYNREIIDKAGLTPPQHAKDAWTWSQFVEALHKVKPHTALPLSLHMDEQSDEWFTYAFSPLIWSNNGQLIDTDNDKTAEILNSPQSIEAIRNWQKLFTDELAQATSTNPNPFAAGLAAFDWTGHWMLPSFESSEGLKFGAMPLPKMGNTPVCPSGSWCWGLSSDCKDRQAAYKVMRWFLDPENGIKPIVTANGAVPARRSAFALFPQFEQMPQQLFREQLERNARARPRTAAYLTLTSEFASALKDIALGADVEQSLTKAANTVQRTLDRQ